MDTSHTEQFLQTHWQRYPVSTLQDLRKALYQSAFGCGHLVTDFSAAAERIRAELPGLREHRGDVEPLDGPWSRVFLGICSTGLTAETLAAAFLRSAAQPCEGETGLTARMAVLRELLLRGALPFSPDEFDRETALWRAAGFPACRHSKAYRAAYHPAYRVLHQRYIRLLPLLTALDCLLAKQERVLLAIEGGAASGKTTLADTLAELYPAVSIVHADDFFLRPEQRTPERYAQPGGNLDRERLKAEVLAPLRRGEPPVYRPFDCRTCTLKAPVSLAPARLTIVEGAYSLHPALAPYYDLSVFLNVHPDTQRQRILARNGPEWGQMFFDRWIPLENAYFQAASTPKRCTLTLEE